MLEGIVFKELKQFIDTRGWLAEIFRSDELPEELNPAMAYISSTNPGISRGPHEHLEQTDYFCFLGTSTFNLYLWENRPGKADYQVRQIFTANKNTPFIAIIPPRIVHAYKNIGDYPGLVLNFPNSLYGRKGKKFPIDEVRHENWVSSRFQIG